MGWRPTYLVALTVVVVLAIVVIWVVMSSMPLHGRGFGPYIYSPIPS